MIGYYPIRSTTIIWQGLSGQQMLHRAWYNGSMIITTFGWEDDDNIDTSHVILLFGDQHLATFRTTVMPYEAMKSDWSLVHDWEYFSHGNTL